jgi:hypothetical protein
MEPMDAETASLDEIWKQVFDLVRREIDVATVWLAMQAVKPLVIDGSFFVATLPLESQFLVINLQSSEASLAIEDALQKVVGRVLAFRLIEGQTVADWEREKQRASAVPPSRPSASSAPPPTSRPKASAGDAPRSSGPAREVFTTWEKLNERLTHGYKAAPFMKYPQGQAGYIMLCVAHISDTMDLFMPGPGQPRDEAQERTLAKTLERLGSVVNLDPLFIGLELIRFRRAEGKDVGF